MLITNTTFPIFMFKILLGFPLLMECEILMFANDSPQPHLVPFYSSITMYRPPALYFQLFTPCLSIFPIFTKFMVWCTLKSLPSKHSFLLKRYKLFSIKKDWNVHHSIYHCHTKTFIKICKIFKKFFLEALILAFTYLLLTYLSDSKSH